MEALLEAVDRCRPVTAFGRAKDAVLTYLRGQGVASEASVRKHCGNTPDISKALRLLVKTGEVGRYGDGGKAQVFKYFVT